MFNKQDIADKTYTYLKNGSKILLVLMPSLRSEAKIIEPILDFAFKQLEWSGVITNSDSVEKRNALKAAIEATFESVKSSAPRYKYELLERAWPQIEPLLKGITAEQLISGELYEQIHSALTNPANLEAEIITDMGINSIICTLIGQLEQNLNNTVWADILNNEKINDVRMHIQAIYYELDVTKGKVAAIEDGINRLDERVTDIESISPPRRNVMQDDNKRYADAYVEPMFMHRDSANDVNLKNLYVKHDFTLIHDPNHEKGAAECANVIDCIKYFISANTIFIQEPLVIDNRSIYTAEHSDFSGIDLRDADLRFAGFRFCTISGADFSNSILQSADFEGSTLHGTLFVNADLSHASLKGCDLQDGIFTSAKLAHTTLPDGKMFECSLKATEHMRSLNIEGLSI